VHSRNDPALARGRNPSRVIAALLEEKGKAWKDYNRKLDGAGAAERGPGKPQQF